MLGLPSILLAAVAVTFPAENQRLPATGCTYVIGSAETNRRERLYLNGVGVDVYRTGAFLAMAKTSPGTNTLTFVQGTNTLIRRFVVASPPKAAEKPAAAKPETQDKPRDPYADLGIPTNAVFAAKPSLGTPLDRIHIMIDAGHGGRDTGALSPCGMKEKDFNLLQAKAVEAKLKRAGFKVTMTRSGDTFPSLYDRPRRAYREKADAFVSIHHNATAPGTDPRDARHCVTYASNEKGLALARAVQRHLAQAVEPVRSVGAQMKSLAVCRNPAVPSCLVEVDFINLPEGEEASSDEARRDKVATAIVLGILDWLADEETQGVTARLCGTTGKRKHMYIKLTKTDGRPIWLNASFIVTVEPMQNGGAIVVPIGDGLDYEVKETPETVLAMLGDAPPPAVVPVPPPKSLAPQPEDVSPEDQDEKGAEVTHKADEGRKPSRKPAQKTQRKKSAVAKQTQKKEEPPKSQTPSAGEDIKAIAVKLKANKCRTENRLRNFIKSCYKKADEAEVSRVVDALKKDGYIVVKEDGHISWTEVV